MPEVGRHGGVAQRPLVQVAEQQSSGRVQVMPRGRQGGGGSHTPLAQRLGAQQSLSAAQRSPTMRHAVAGAQRLPTQRLGAQQSLSA